MRGLRAMDGGKGKGKKDPTKMTDSEVKKIVRLRKWAMEDQYRFARNDRANGRRLRYIG